MFTGGSQWQYEASWWEVTFQIAVFVYQVIILTNQGHSVGPDGPAYMKVRFKIQDDDKKWVSMSILDESFVTQRFVQANFSQMQKE